MSDTIAQKMNSILKAEQSLWSVDGNALKVETQNRDKAGDTLTTDVVYNLKRNEVIEFTNMKSPVVAEMKLSPALIVCMVATAGAMAIDSGAGILVGAVLSLGFLGIDIGQSAQKFSERKSQEKNTQNDRDAVKMITGNLMSGAPITITNPLVKAQIAWENGESTRMNQEGIPVYFKIDDMLLQIGRETDTFHLHNVSQADNKTGLNQDALDLLLNRGHDFELRYVPHTRNVAKLEIHMKDMKR